MSKWGNTTDHEALVSRMRRQSIATDSERKNLGELADKLALLGGQVATVARMADEDGLVDIIDDR
jgi:NTP pyrophosphatase (non-canonical NTP hydrolase)